MGLQDMDCIHEFDNKLMDSLWVYLAAEHVLTGCSVQCAVRRPLS